MAQDETGTNSKIRRSGQVGEGDDDILNLADVLREHELLQADADAVLGGSDEYNCSYPKGYLKRQALYACSTCTPEGNAGICLACCYACHDGHDIHELYTKRNFRCDCGNDKFKGQACQIYKEKKEMNSRNRYDQNFKGLYCSCSRPYPDEDDPVADEMIQCIMCEDWYHKRHLNTEAPDNTDYHEMICTGCMCRHSFLWAYHVQCAVTQVKNDANEDDCKKLEVTDDAEDKTALDTKLDNASGGETKNSPVQKNDAGQSSPTSDAKTVKRKVDTQDAGNMQPCTKKAKMEDRKTEVSNNNDDSEQCLLRALQQRDYGEPEKAAFWAEGWRAKLCRCNSCMEMYEDKRIAFLIDDSDTMEAYEKKGQEAAAEATAEDDAQTAAFNAMGRVQQIEVVQGVMDLQTELTEFLNRFAREGKVVREADVREFFAHMEERRRSRSQNPQYNCR